MRRVQETEVEALIEALSLWFQSINPEATLRNTYSYILGVWLPEVPQMLLERHSPL